MRLVMLNGLRIYVNRNAPEIEADCVEFYSRRSDGPYYRWRYETKIERWRSARMNLSDFSPGDLRAFNWKVVPSDLQRRLIEHYQE